MKIKKVSERNETTGMKKCYRYSQSPTQWPPMASIIYLCQHLTVSCNTHLCSRFCILNISLVVTLTILLLFELLKILLENGNIYMGTILYWSYSMYFGLCIRPTEWKHWSELLRTMTRVSCLGTAKCIIFNIYLKRNELLLFFFRHWVIHTI